MWVSFGTPCSGIFLPTYIDGVIPAALARCEEEQGAPGSAWWAFQRLQNAVSNEPSRHTPLVREGWKGLEAQIASERGAVEKKAASAHRAGDRDAAADVLSDFMARNTEAALALADQLANQLR